MEIPEDITIAQLKVFSRMVEGMNLEVALIGLSDCPRMRVSAASPEYVLSLSHGEVTKPGTINSDTLRPEMDGLLCERIFGPTKDWACSCGRYSKMRYRGVICDRCGVEVTYSKVRGERMGHIVLRRSIPHPLIPESHLSVLAVIPPDLRLRGEEVNEVYKEIMREGDDVEGRVHHLYTLLAGIAGNLIGVTAEEVLKSIG